MLTRAAFTAGDGVGYNGHHEGARHVARCAAVAAAKGRGPPAGTGEPLPCPGLTTYITRRWCHSRRRNHQSHQPEAVARRSNQLRTGLRACTGGFYASKHTHALPTG